MSRQTKDSQNSTVSQTGKEVHSSSQKVIFDREDSSGFDVDWDTIEKNYKRHRSHHHHHSKSSSSQQNVSKKKKWSKKKKFLIGLLIAFFCLIAGLISSFFIMRYLGKLNLLNYKNMNISIPDGIDYEDNGRTVYYNGHVYRFNENIASLLFMGIDNTELRENVVTGSAGQADALYLFTYDTSNGKIRILCLNRDTMTDVSRYDNTGKYYDTTSTQLCLAYAYGDGKTLSAENQVTAVSRLIYNIPIHAYYAIDLSAIKILNDDIGGVTLTPEYTFAEFVKGQQITIKGDLAESFVRHRDTRLVDDNLRRMACQRLYITSFANQIVPAIRKDLRIPFQLYQDSSRYTVTNINISDLTYLASTMALDFSGLDLVTTEGAYKMVAGDESAQFHLKKDKFFETILSIYYTQIK